MKLTKALTTAGFLFAAAVATSSSMFAQGPMYDKVIVDLPYRVTINNTVLEPGHYVIRQLDDPGGGSRVLQIFSNDGMKLRTTSMTIPTLDNNTPENTKIVLHHYGSDYYFDKIWIQGKNYGYEFPLPNAVKSRIRERSEPYTVAATYEQTRAPEPVAQNTPPPAPAPAPEPAPQQPTETAQNTPPPAPAPEPAPAPAPAPERMPTTSVGWLTLVISGAMFTGAGLLLRRVHA
ncbi:MAG TPA: hypothetical protein VGL72_00020 [Bryobacteraceae bacterium]|jgi:hypothetical protein